MERTIQMFKKLISQANDYAITELKKLQETSPVDYLYLLYNPDEKLIEQWCILKIQEYILLHKGFM